MKATKRFCEIRQSFGVEGITRCLLRGYAFRHLLEEGAASGLMFNPAALAWAVKNRDTYDEAIRKMLGEKVIGEELLIELVIADARRAADLFRPIYDQTDGLDGWLSLDVSPRAYDDPRNLANAVKALYARVRRPNIMVSVPGTKKGLIAVSDAVSEGVPVNITNLFSPQQFRSAAEAYLKGVEQRMRAGLKPDPGSAAFLRIGPWGDERKKEGSNRHSNPLGDAIFRRTYNDWKALFQLPRWKQACRKEARPLRLLCKGIDIDTPRVLKALTAKKRSASLTVFTLPGKRANQSIRDEWSFGPIRTDDKDSDKVISRHNRAGRHIDHSAEVFQKDAVSFFVKGWFDLMTAIACKSAAFVKVGP